MGDSYPHHLAALVKGKTVLEIHTRLMHPCWRLPEDAMLSTAEPPSSVPE